mgnify:CR=1 FL=1
MQNVLQNKGELIPFSREKRPTLSELRELPGLIQVPLEENTLACSKVSGGIPRGAITEIAHSNGSGRTQVFLQLLREHPPLRAAWVERELSLNPAALPLEGIDVDRLFFVEGGDHLLWSTQQLLRSQLFPIVVLERGQKSFSDQDLRRLQILAHQGNTALLLMSERPMLRASWVFRRKA